MTNELKQQIATLKTKLATVDRIDPCGKFYNGVCELLDGVSYEDLGFIRDQNIKFVSKLAQNRMWRKEMAAA